jgi:hypothetical protein
MYVVLVKEKPGIGCTKGLALAAARPMTIQLHKLKHNLLHKPELTGNL